MRLRVLPGGSVVVIAPAIMTESSIERFVNDHCEWIERASLRMKRLIQLPVSGRRSYLLHKENALIFVIERIKHLNTFYKFTYGRISIKNTKCIWGSCSRKGNLNFSYKLLFLPRDIADYIIVHELCHLREHNHSKNLWMT